MHRQHRGGSGVKEMETDSEAKRRRQTVEERHIGKQGEGHKRGRRKRR